MGFDPSSIVVACRRIVERHPFTGALWWLCANVVTSVDPYESVWEFVEQIGGDRTAAELAAALSDDATVAVVGCPSIIGDALARRGDVRTLVIDAGDVASALLRRLDRADVDSVVVDSGAAGAAVRACDVVLIEALAVDGERAVVPIGSSTLAATARAWNVPIWLVAGVGRRLPSGYLDHMVERYEAATDPDVEHGVAPWDMDVEIIASTMCTDVIGPYGLVPPGPPAFVAECPMAPELLRASPM